MSLLEFFCDRNRDAAAVLAELYPEGETQVFGDRVHPCTSRRRRGFRGAGGRTGGRRHRRQAPRARKDRA